LAVAYDHFICSVSEMKPWLVRTVFHESLLYEFLTRCLCKIRWMAVEGIVKPTPRLIVIHVDWVIGTDKCERHLVCNGDHLHDCKSDQATRQGNSTLNELLHNSIARPKSWQRNVH